MEVYHSQFHHTTETSNLQLSGPCYSVVHADAHILNELLAPWHSMLKYNANG